MQKWLQGLSDPDLAKLAAEFELNVGRGLVFWLALVILFRHTRWGKGTRGEGLVQLESSDAIKTLGGKPVGHRTLLWKHTKGLVLASTGAYKDVDVSSMRRHRLYFRAVSPRSWLRCLSRRAVDETHCLLLVGRRQTQGRHRQPSRAHERNAPDRWTL